MRLKEDSWNVKAPLGSTVINLMCITFPINILNRNLVVSNCDYVMNSIPHRVAIILNFLIILCGFVVF